MSYAAVPSRKAHAHASGYVRHRGPHPMDYARVSAVFFMNQIFAAWTNQAARRLSVSLPRPPSEAELFVQKLAVTLGDADENGIDAAIDYIYNYCLDKIEIEDFGGISSALRLVVPSSLPVEVMLAPLSITVSVARRVTERNDYYRRVAAELVLQKVEDIAGLLAGLE